MPKNLLRNAVILAAVFAAGFLATRLVTPEPTPPAAADFADVGDLRVAPTPALLSGPVIGNENGDVTIVEFFDYTCVYCKAVEPRLAEAVRRDGNVRLVLKEYPILTPESLIASRAALASIQQGKYAAYHRAMMAYAGILDERAIFDTAEQVGLDVAQLKQDMAAPDIADAIIANFNLARALRRFQTPSFIVGSRILTEDSADIDFPKRIADARAGN